jgi:hypothetical protein
MREIIEQIRMEAERLNDLALSLEKGADRGVVGASLMKLSGRVAGLALKSSAASTAWQINAAGGTVVHVAGDQQGTINMGGS